MTADPLRNLAAEQAVLGSLLLDRDAIIAVAPLLARDDFADPSNQRVYQAIRDLYDRRVPADLVTVAEQARRLGGVDETYLAELVTAAPVSVHATYYAETVRELSVRRRLVAAARVMARDALDVSVPIEQVLSGAGERLTEVTTAGEAGPGWLGAMAIAEAAERELDGRKRAERAVLTGYRTLDRLTGGFTPGQLIVVGARPSVGKSAFAAQVAYQHAIQQGRPVGIVSLEMHAGEIGARLVALLSRVNTHRYRLRPQPDPEEQDRVVSAIGRLSNGQVHVLRQPRGELSRVLADARAGHARHGFDCLIVDHLHLMSAPGYGSRYGEMSAVSGALKRLAIELDIPVIALAQLNRNPEHRGADAVPKLSDLRDSGTIEADCDIGLLIHRQPYSANPEERLQGRFLLQKHRNGPTGDVEVRWVEEQARFVELSEEWMVA